MNVLTTRTLRFRDEHGHDAPVILTIFEPTRDDNEGWSCIFDFEPPIRPRNAAGRGVDWIQAFTVALRFARLYFETTKWSRTGHWQGMQHLGLPDSTNESPGGDSTEIPKLEERSGTLDALTTRRLAFSSEIELTIYRPFAAPDGSWKCAFSFDPIDAGLIRYGTGADFIESLLDTLATARCVFEQMNPSGSTGSDELLDCVDFPIKRGRVFRICRS